MSIGDDDMDDENMLGGKPLTEEEVTKELEDLEKNKNLP
jgi:hypothetical protein